MITTKLKLLLITLILIAHLRVYSTSFTLDWNQLSLNVPIEGILSVYKVRIEPRDFGDISNVFIPANGSIIYVKTANGYLLRSLISGDKLVVLSYTNMVDSDPIALEEDKSNVYILTKNGTYFVLNKALNIIKEKKCGLGKVRYLGKAWNKDLFITSRGYIVSLNPTLNVLGILQRGYIPVFTSPSEFVKLDESVLIDSLNISLSNSKLLVKNNVTIVVSKSRNEIKVAYITYDLKANKFKLINYKELANSTIIENERDIIIANKVGNACSLIPLLSNLSLKVRNCESIPKNLSDLGIFVDVYGFRSRVFVIDNRVISVRPKDSNILFSMYGADSCYKIDSKLYCISSGSLYRVDDPADSHTILRILLTPKFLNLVRSSKIVSTLSALYNVNVKWNIEFNANERSKVIEVPSGTYTLSIDTEIGRVMELVPAVPVSWDFDPPIIEIDISPEIIVPYVYVLQLRIIDSQTKKPIEGAQVIIPETLLEANT